MLRVDDLVVVELPTGTVTLLFSDIEGSTVLLSRLGSAYADALDHQRRVLRRAWDAHRGTEMGTEGDSFFVAFETAVAAVAAADEAQRTLAAYAWPEGEHLRVRMGIHTGSPTVHQGAYVGMDVHRAARIAGSAHGGQVVLSASTAELVGASLPPADELRDLGRHQLKDIPVDEHLFQLVIDGLDPDFPPLKTLGGASTLPSTPTGLVGRDGELTELTALLRSPEVRLVTLTGPGGSGKTRLAIALAQLLTDAFTDGLFFVPLSAVTTQDVMWTAIGEVLDVPPAGRALPALFTHVAHRHAALVLDNLEQVSGADAVVAQLLAAAHRLTVIATSRRPLHITAEHEHPVPMLELPDQVSVAEAERSGAVQLFVQQTRMVRPRFDLTAQNVADVVELCRRLDGLPLAIELVAARGKLLSPAALLARLDRALEIKNTAVDRPIRQQTLHDTIDWSYRLLDPAHQAFFRRLGVIAGSADLDAVAALTTGGPAGTDPLDLVADLVDASLATIHEDDWGDPRIGLLETVRTFARDELQHAGEHQEVRRSHALHYQSVAEVISRLMASGREDQHLEARRRFELELDNFRQALTWAVPPDDAVPSPEQVSVGLRLCVGLAVLWEDRGSFAEGQGWMERAVAAAGDRDSPELADCLAGLSVLLRGQLDLVGGRKVAERSVAIWRRLGDRARLCLPLLRVSVCAQLMGDSEATRQALEEAMAIAGEVGDDRMLSLTLSDLAFLASVEHDYERSLVLLADAIRISERLGDEVSVVRYRHSRACDLREMGRPDDAHAEMSALIPTLLRLADPEWLVLLAEDYAAVLAELGDHGRAARLLGAAEERRERTRTPRSAPQEDEIEEPLDKARAALPAATWEREYLVGRATTVEDALAEAHVETS